MPERPRKPLFVVTLPSVEEGDPAGFSARAKAAGADLLEVRGDLTPGLQPFDGPLPLLVAPRGAGADFIDRFSDVAWVDLEEGERVSFPEGVGRIRSLHDHAATPSVKHLLDAADRLRRDADLAKIAVAVRSPWDLLTLARTREEYPHPDLALMGMGSMAWSQRLRESTTSPLVYACLDERIASAPGQLPLSLYRDAFGKVRSPRLFAVVGGPDLQSMSPAIHNALIRRHGMDAYYGLITGESLDEILAVARAFRIEGLSITAPFKGEAWERSLRTDDLGRTLRSVNTLLLEEDHWIGYQFDVKGIVDGYPDLRRRRRVAVVGSGGVVPAVLEALRQLHAGHVSLYARNENRRRALAARFQVDDAPLAALADESVDLLVWTLPLDVSSIPLPQPLDDAVALDLRYARHQGFQAEARQRGFSVRDGSRMLMFQALAQFELFTGVTTTPADFLYLEELMSSHGEQ